MFCKFILRLAETKEKSDIISEYSRFPGLLHSRDEGRSDFLGWWIAPKLYIFSISIYTESTTDAEHAGWHIAHYHYEKQILLLSLVLRTWWMAGMELMCGASSQILSVSFIFLPLSLLQNYTSYCQLKPGSGSQAMDLSTKVDGVIRYCHQYGGWEVCIQFQLKLPLHLWTWEGLE